MNGYMILFLASGGLLFWLALISGVVAALSGNETALNTFKKSSLLCLLSVIGFIASAILGKI